jgi:hypothetical protein
MYKMHHPKADIHINRKGGRGTLHIEVIYKAEIIDVADI